MKIGIDGSRAYLGNKTGIEDYAYQTIGHLTKHLKGEQVILYVKKGQKETAFNDEKFSFPDNWEIKEIPFKYLWTQFGLALEMFLRPIDMLFVPAHTVPFIHPKNTVVTIHGLEYEHCPESYSFWGGKFHQFFVRKSCKWASKIIAVSKNTKKDLIKLYKIEKEKITVVYNGFESKNLKPVIEGEEKKDFNWADVKDFPASEKKTNSKIDNFLLFVGRLEQRKNVLGMIESFEILKRNYSYKGKLVLAGKYGHGSRMIRNRIARSEFQRDIVCLGYIRDEQKWELFHNASIFLFPSLCEGFGIPILEAQSCGLPVITSNYGPMDEVAGDKNTLVNPLNFEEMAKKINEILKDETFRKNIIEKGSKNVKRFSWEKSGEEVAKVIRKK